MRGLAVSKPGRRVGTRTGRQDAVLETDRRAAFDLERLPIDKAASSGHNRYLPAFGQLAQMSGESVDDPVLLAAQHGQVDLGPAELEAPARRLLGTGKDVGGVQQDLGRNTADEQAGPAQPRRGIDQGDLHAAVGSQECGRISTRAAAQDE